MDKRPANLEEFFSNRPRRIYKEGQIIIRADESPNGVYLIEKGFVKLYSLGNNGEERDRIFYKQGDIFPLVWTFTSTMRNMFFEAMTDCILKKVSKAEFMDFVKNDNKHLLEAIDRILVILNVYVDRVDNLSYEKTYNRLISTILFLGKRFGKHYGKSLLLDIPITHKDIANSTAMSRETVSREIEKMAKDGLLVQRGRIIVINDIKKLKKELETNS